jgi:hypothetical protein
MTVSYLLSGSYSTGLLEPIPHDYHYLARFVGFYFRTARNIKFETCGMEKILQQLVPIRKTIYISVP